MKENLQRVEKRGVIRRGTEIGRGTRIEIGLGAEARIKIERGTGTETGIENEIGTETGIVIVIIETATGIVRGVSEGEIGMMMMRITTVAATMIGMNNFALYLSDKCSFRKFDAIVNLTSVDLIIFLIELF